MTALTLARGDVYLLLYAGLGAVLGWFVWQGIVWLFWRLVDRWAPRPKATVHRLRQHTANGRTLMGATSFPAILPADPFLAPAGDNPLDKVDPAWGLGASHPDHPNNVEYRCLVDANPAAIAGTGTCDTKHEHEIQVVTDLIRAYCGGNTDCGGAELNLPRTQIRVDCNQPLASEEFCYGVVTLEVADLVPATANERRWLREYGARLEAGVA